MIAGIYRWTFEPQVLLPIAVAAAVYGWRVRDLRLQGGPSGPAGPGGLRIAAFYGGLALAVIALCSPIDTIGEQRLFTAHMIQHLLLTDLVPILLLLGLTRTFLRPAVRRLRPLEEALGPLAHPAAALLAYVGFMWLWHIPAMYDLALDHAWAHALEHASFFTAGIAFWWFVLEPVPPRHRLRGPWSIAYMSGAKLAMGVLGVVLTFSPDLMYDHYRHVPRTWGLSPLADLNLGGVLMMVEQSVVLVIFFALLFARMLEDSEQAERRRERFEAG